MQCITWLLIQGHQCGIWLPANQKNPRVQITNCLLMYSIWSSTWVFYFAKSKINLKQNLNFFYIHNVIYFTKWNQILQDFSTLSQNTDFATLSQYTDFATLSQYTDFATLRQNRDFATLSHSDFATLCQYTDFATLSQNTDFATLSQNTDFQPLARTQNLQPSARTHICNP